MDEAEGPEKEVSGIWDRYTEVHRRILELSSIGTDPMAVQKLQVARELLEDGNAEDAQASMEEAVKMAEEVTRRFLNEYIIEIRNTMLTLRVHGGMINRARPMLITAKKAMFAGDLQMAMEHAISSIDHIGGIVPEFLSALKAIMTVKYKLVLAETLGHDLERERDALDQAFELLKEHKYDSAVEMARSVEPDLEALLDTG